MKLIFDNVCAAYGKKQILENISFCLPENGITALVGRNGAGKSTLIRCLMGIKQDYRGSICVDRQDVRKLPPSRRAELFACLMQQLPSVHVTLQELVAFGRAPYLPISGRLRKADHLLVRQAIHNVGLDGYENAFVDTLSGGEQKKAFFAMTLAQDTPFVILDEPTAHLDTASRFEFLNLAARLHRETGKTFLMIMHDLPEVLRYADHIIAIHENRIAFEGNATLFLEKDIAPRCFHVRIAGDASRGYTVSPL